MDAIDDPLDCRSEEGVTVGLIDALITIAHALSGRNLESQHVKEALKDLYSDADMRAIQIEAATASFIKV